MAVRNRRITAKDLAPGGDFNFIPERDEPTAKPITARIRTFDDTKKEQRAHEFTNLAAMQTAAIQEIEYTQSTWTVQGEALLIDGSWCALFAKFGAAATEEPSHAD